MLYLLWRVKIGPRGTFSEPPSTPFGDLITYKDILRLIHKLKKGLIVDSQIFETHLFYVGVPS